MGPSDEKTDPSDELSIERVSQVGDYFKALFVRSLELGLDIEAPPPALPRPAPHDDHASRSEVEAAADLEQTPK